MTFHYTCKIYLLICDMLADGTTLHISGNGMLQIRSNMQDSLDQVSSRCVNGHQADQDQVYDNRYQTEHQLSSLPLDLVLREAKIYQVSDNRLLGITTDSKLRWDSHTGNVCNTVSRRVFLLSKLRYIVEIDTKNLFFNAHIKPHIN